MSFALVEWKEPDEDVGTTSILPVSWVKEPSSLATAQFPVAGKCSWKKRNGPTYDAVILAISGKVLLS